MGRLNKKQPLVGIGVLVIKDGKILLGKRLGSHGHGQYSMPGGHLEYMESFAECARRECKEETGIKIKNIRQIHCCSCKKYAPKHYVHIGLVAEWKSGIPVVKEPKKCGGWGWYDVEKLPKPLFALAQETISEHIALELDKLCKSLARDD